MQGDEALSEILLGGIEVAGIPVEWNGRRRYLAGELPVGDAFIAWARTSASPGDAGEWERVIPIWWALPWHLLSAGLVLLLAWPLRRLRLPRSR